MATLATLTWIFVVLIAISECIMVFKTVFFDKGDEIDTSSAAPLAKLILYGMLGIPAFLIQLISRGIFFDLYGKFPDSGLTTAEGVRLSLISALVALGIFSISAFVIFLIYKKRDGNIIHYSYLHPLRYKAQISPGTLVVFSIQAVGLISSVLGIISFYLDYLK